MESETSGIVRLGIVLIALAVLIGLGFGIFQISKSVANDGVGDVQKELDNIAASAFENYDQKTVTGIMASGAISDFEGESIAVLIATQTWNNAINKYFNKKAGTSNQNIADLAKNDTTVVIDVGAAGSDGRIGIRPAATRTGSFEYMTTGVETGYNQNGNTIPIIFAFEAMMNGKCEVLKLTRTSTGKSVPQTFVNYNAILGNINKASNGILGNGDNGTTMVIPQKAVFGGYLSAASGTPTEVYMAYIYFEADCYRCTSGFATTDGGRVIFNNVTSNITKSGRAEFIPNGASFEAYLIKDESGSTIGITLSQLSTN